ncbi:MAG: hypothetical protein ABIY46_15305 [Gemmatimonadales bacterium]
MSHFPSQVTGSLFVAAAVMRWLGGWLLPARPSATCLVRFRRVFFVTGIGAVR